MNEIIKTIDFYNKNAKELKVKYDNANMQKLHNLLLNYIDKYEKILEIGFGSGRDMKFLIKNGYDVYGVEASDEFIKEIVKEELINSSKIFNSYLPELNLPKEFENFFDTILMIAVFMHISKKDYQKSIQNISKYLKDKAKVIISLSITKREEKDRFFEEFDREYFIKTFKENGFKEIFSTKNLDVTNRKIEWETFVLERK